MSNSSELSEKVLRDLAKDAIIKYWNSNDELISEYGTINKHNIYVIWQCQIANNFKALLKLYFNDIIYFEFTLLFKDHINYLDVYKLDDRIILNQNDDH